MVLMERREDVDKNEWYLGDWIGFYESETDEFKEFCIKKDVLNYMDGEYVKKVVRSGKLCERTIRMIEESVNDYFLQYTVKYASAFSGSSCICSLYIGVNDFGLITGVPHVGEMDVGIFEDVVSKCKSQLLFDGCRLRDYKISVHIHPLKIDMRLLDDSVESVLKTVDDANKEYMGLMRDYVERKKVFIRNIRDMTVKLETLVNRESFRCKLKQVVSSSCSSDIVKERILNTLNTRELITFDHAEIDSGKSDPRSLVYWVALLKDTLVQRELRMKPKEPLISKKAFGHVYVLQKMTPMAKRILKHTPNIGFSVIEIRFHPVPTKLSFMNRFNKKETYIRTHCSNGPCCEVIQN